MNPKSGEKSSKIDTNNLSIFETIFFMNFDEFWSVGSSKFDQKQLVFIGDGEVRESVTSRTSGSIIDDFGPQK